MRSTQKALENQRSMGHYSAKEYGTLFSTKGVWDTIQHQRSMGHYSTPKEYGTLFSTKGVWDTIQHQILYKI